MLYPFVVRHPLDTVRSLEQAPYFRPEALVDPDVRSALRRHGHGRRGFAEYWAEVNRTMVTFAPLAGSRARFLRYEDLVADPERCIESVLAFIDEHPAPNLVERAFQRPHDVGFGDWKIRDTHGIHADSIGSFSSWDAAEIDCLWPVVSDFGAIFGYDRAAPIVRPRGGPAGAWNLLAD